MTDTPKKRQADPDAVRLRAVKRAGERLRAAQSAFSRAGLRLGVARAAVDDLITDAPEMQRAYLRSVAGLTETGEPAA